MALVPTRACVSRDPAQLVGSDPGPPGKAAQKLAPQHPPTD
jgi:hypothetical protein